MRFTRSVKIESEKLQRYKRNRSAISKVKAYRNEFDFYTALCVEQLTGVKSGQGVTFKLNDF